MRNDVKNNPTNYVKNDVKNAVKRSVKSNVNWGVYRRGKSWARGVSRRYTSYFTPFFT